MVRNYTHLRAIFFCTEEILQKGIDTMSKATSSNYGFEITPHNDYGFEVVGKADDIMHLIGYMAVIGSNTLYSVRVIE